MREQRPLLGTTAWVTGASRGIGRAVALKIARLGAVVCAGARNQEALRQLSEAATVDSATIHALPLDVSSFSACEEFAAKAEELAGPPTYLINNAGYGLFQDLDVMSPEEFSRQIDVNLKGPWHMIKLAAPGMKNLGRGTIINVSSIAGRSPFQRGAAYNAGKAGLNLMSEALMMELRDSNIRVAVVAPGSVDTQFHGDALPRAHPKDQDWMLEPEHIADSIVHIIQLPDKALTNYYEIRPLHKAPR